MACRIRSSSSTRLGSPVNWSWWARWFTNSVSFFRSVMSKAMPRYPTILSPFSPWVFSAVMARFTHMRDPSLRT